MKINKNLFILLACLVISSYSYSQEVNVQEVLNGYQKELKLDDDQKNQFLAILEKYTPQFAKKEINFKDYNRLLKLETLEIYDILSREQFGIYKKLKESIEPSKKYRFENTNR